MSHFNYVGATVIVSPFRVSREQRQQPGPPLTSVPALSSHQLSAVTNKVNRLLTLSRVFSEDLDFRDFGSSRGQRSESKYASNVGRTLPVVPSQYLSRVPLGHPNLTFKDIRGSGPYGGATESASSGVQGLLLDSSHLR